VSILLDFLCCWPKGPAATVEIRVMLRTGLTAAMILGLGAASAQAAPGHFGAMVDLGVPDGANAALVFRPWRFLDIHAGGGYNAVSPGVRVGAALHLLPTTVSPVIAAEAGHYFDGDGNAAVMRYGLAADSDDPLLRQVGYDYANVHLGLNFGRERMVIFIHAGWSIVKGTLHNADEEFDAQDGGALMQDFRADPTITIITPSARLGAEVFF
jgi:hypothetical protein